MIVTLTGSNQFLIRHELDKITRGFVSKHGELAIEKIDGEEAEFERLNEAITNLPFLINRKLVILRNPSKIAKFRENIEQIISTIPDSNDVVILETKPDKRLAYYKILKAKSDLRELNELSDSELAAWLVKRAKDNNGLLAPSDAQYLVEQAGPNQQLLSNELDKLLSYNPRIDRESIDLLVEPNPRSTVFNLLDATFSGDKVRALKLYEEQRRQKVEPLEIMAMIAWQLRILALVKTAGQRSRAEIALQAKLNPFVVQKSAEIAAGISLDSLKQLINETIELEVSLKSENIDADEALKHFLLSFRG